MKAAWKRQSLACLAKVFTDGDWIESKDQSGVGIRLIQTGNVGVGTFKDRADKGRYISEATFHRLRCEEIFSGDCLISRLPDPVGRACIVPETRERLITAVDCTIVRFDKAAILPAFFNYFAQESEYLRLVASRCTGTTRNRISRSSLGEIEVPFPSLREQERIVAILDQAFAGIAAATERIEASIINSKTSFETLLDAALIRTSKDWPSKRLSEVSMIDYGYTESATNERVGPKFLRITDIQDGSVDWDRVPYCKIPDESIPKYLLQDGDIVFARTGATTGKSFQVANPPHAVFASYLIRVRQTKADIIPPLLSYLFKTTSYWKAVRAGTSGSAQGGFNATKLAALEICYPKSTEEQRTLALELDSLAGETDRLKSVYQNKLAALGALKQSLLHQAFSGNL